MSTRIDDRQGLPCTHDIAVGAVEGEGGARVGAVDAQDVGRDFHRLAVAGSKRVLKSRLMRVSRSRAGAERASASGSMQGRAGAQGRRA